MVQKVACHIHGCGFSLLNRQAVKFDSVPAQHQPRRLNRVGTRDFVVTHHDGTGAEKNFFGISLQPVAQHLAKLARVRLFEAQNHAA
jgi:hypothetical protein